MSYAIIRNNTPVELPPSASIESNGVQFSYDTMLLWSDAERKASDIYTITDDAVPDGKTANGSTLIFKSGKITRKWTLEDTPARQPPRAVSAAQAKVALFNAGLYDAAVTAISDSYKPIQIYWESASDFEIDHPYIQGIGALLNLPDEKVGELFMQASAI